MKKNKFFYMYNSAAVLTFVYKQILDSSTVVLSINIYAYHDVPSIALSGGTEMILQGISTRFFTLLL